jgi:hypothetical protein
MKKSIVAFIAMMMLLTMVSCTSSNSKKVRDGHLDGFGHEATVGEVFDVVSDNSTSWDEQELDDSRYSNETYSLVEAKWNGESGKVVIQFVVEKDGNNFLLHGATVDGQFVEAYPLVEQINKEYLINDLIDMFDE